MNNKGNIRWSSLTSSTTSSSSISQRCQDCGNQAKKECGYLRCRTCCKSKGFHCQTHVKSTWVPLYRRRQKQFLQQQQQHFHHHHVVVPNNHPIGNNPRRLITPNLASSHQGFEEKDQNDDDDQNVDHEDIIDTRKTDGKFPVEVNATTTFHAVRVSSVVAGSAAAAAHQYAYQTSVVIGGHVFKGILYDQGPTAAYFGLVAGDHDHHRQNYVVAANQRPLFVGSSAAAVQGSTTGTAHFMSSAGMQFFPNRQP